MLLLRAGAFTPVAAAWLIDSDFFADAHPDLRAARRCWSKSAAGVMAAVWLHPSGRPCSKPGAEWKEPHHDHASRPARAGYSGLLRWPLLGLAALLAARLWLPDWFEPSTPIACTPPRAAT